MHYKLLRQSNDNMSLQFSCCTTAFILKNGNKCRPPEQNSFSFSICYTTLQNHTCTPSSCLTCNKNFLHARTVKRRALIGPIYTNFSTLHSCETWNLCNTQAVFLNYTINTCWASSLVGANTSAWVSLNSISNCCRMEIANVAVLPVPDWAWAITSYPKKSRIHIYRSHIKPSLLVHTMYSIWNMNYAQIIKWSAIRFSISGQSRKMIAIISL